jgi:hypothetical protein
MLLPTTQQGQHTEGERPERQAGFHLNLLSRLRMHSVFHPRHLSNFGLRRTSII